MGKRGPPKTPTATLEARGSWLAKRNAKEPKPLIGRPARPQWLTGDAKKLWDVLAPQLEAMNVLAKIDREALARYCQLWMRWREVERFIAKEGSTYEMLTKDGESCGPRPYPQVKIASDLASHLSRLEREFGLTPASRASVEVMDDGSSADLDDEKFLKLG